MLSLPDWYHEQWNGAVLQSSALFAADLQAVFAFSAARTGKNDVSRGHT